MYFSSIGRWLFIAALSMFAMPAAAAAPIGPEAVVGDIMQLFEASQISDTILEAAKSLFWSLALISLVWTMGMLIVRQDIGELLMELLRFIIVTGLFYWVLVNASSRQGGQGFVEDIVMSFLGMVNDQASDESIRKSANDILARCLHVFFMVINETADGQDADRLIVGAMVTMIVCIGAVMAAQFLIALVMAWILGYAGIFLLGFGGARWTSPIAVNYYKHVLAVGVAMLALSLIGAITSSFIDELGLSPNGRVYSKFDYLGLMLAVMILMQALAIKVPQLLYTLVTGSTLGLYAGSANAAGTAIAVAGSSAYSTAFSRPHGGGGAGGSGAPWGPPGGSPGHRAESVMDAVQRSASAAGGMADPFHVHSGADPFGVRRAPDPLRGGRGGSVFGNAGVGAAMPAPVVEPPVVATGAPEVSASGARDTFHAGRPDRHAGTERPMRSVGDAVAAARSDRVAGNQGDGSVDTDMDRGAVDRNIEPRTHTAAMVREDIPGIVGDVPAMSEHATGRHGSVLPEAAPGSIPSAKTAPATARSDNRPSMAGHAERNVRATDVHHATSQTNDSVLHDTEIHTSTAGAMPTEDRHTLHSTTVTPGVEINDAGTSSQDVHDHDLRTLEVHHASQRGTTSSDTPAHNVSVRNASANDAAVQTPDMRTMQSTAVRPPAETAMPLMSAAIPDVESVSTRETESPVAPDQMDREASPAKTASSRKPAEGPMTSVAQEDMKPARSIEEVQVVMPGATISTSVPADAHVLPDAANLSAENSPAGYKKKGVRRKPGDAPSSMPPLDDGELPENDKP